MTVSKDDLLRSRLASRPFEIDGVGEVTIRPLSRTEALELNDNKLTLAERDRKLIAAAMVDPALTEDEVRRWQENSPAGELEPLTRALLDLSGMTKSAAKQAMVTFRDEP